MIKVKTVTKNFHFIEKIIVNGSNQKKDLYYQMIFLKLRNTPHK